MTDDEIPFWTAVDAARAADGRYRREAYAFVMHALGVTVRLLPPERLDDPVRRHLSGQELIEGAIRCARESFGVMAPTVFREWGVESGEDVGRIVFQLLDAGVLSARPEDSMEDFRGAPDLLDRLAGTLGFDAGPARSGP